MFDRANRFGPVLALLLATGPAPAGVFADLPDAIVCTVSDPTGVLPWDELVFYVSAHVRGGDTLYKTLTSDPVVVIVHADGKISGTNLADCDGQSITALRRDNRAFDLQESRPPRTR